MANSKVGICNMALTILAAERILSITDKNEAARKCDVLYPMCLDSLLSEHNWNFACCECRLARLAEESKMLQFGAVYQLPDDCIRVQRCIKDYKFKVKGRKLYTNVEPCYIEYITNNVSEGEFSAGFVNALAYRLASTLCFGITRDASLTSFFEKKSKEAVEEAKFTDGQEGIGTFPLGGTLLEAR